MLGSLWNFIKRHRRKFIFTGAVVAGGVYFYKYAQSKLKKFQENEARDSLSAARKQHHFDSNQRTCNVTVLSMLPTIREVLLEALDSETLTSQLKQKPTNKLEIWEQLKIISFTRTLSSVYVTCLVVVFLRVQLNVIGGYMFLDNIGEGEGIESPPAVATPHVQHKYLELVQYILHEGLEHLTEKIKTSVQCAIKEVSLQQHLTLQEIHTKLIGIRQNVEETRQEENSFRLVDTLIDSDQTMHVAGQLSSEELTLIKLKRETVDIVNSADFQYVLTRCLDVAYGRLLDRLAECFKSETPNGFVNPNTVQVAMAKLIPAVNNLVHIICADSPNQYIQELLLLEPVKDLSANVYESFSEQENQSASN